MCLQIPRKYKYLFPEIKHMYTSQIQRMQIHRKLLTFGLVPHEPMEHHGHEHYFITL